MLRLLIAVVALFVVGAYATHAQFEVNTTRDGQYHFGMRDAFIFFVFIFREKHSLDYIYM